MFNKRMVRITFAAVLILIAVIGGLFWQNRPLGWSHENQITQGSGDSRLVDLSTDPSSNTLHLAWEDTRDNSTQVYYKRSVDDGVTWGPDIRLSNLTAGTVEPEPRIGSDGNTVLVFFSDETPTGGHIFYVSSVDGGNYFSSPTQLTYDEGDQSHGALAFVGSTVHFVYQDYFNNGDEHIFYTKSPDGGVTWQDKVALTNTSGAQDHYPAIAAVNDHVFVAWSRYYLFYEAIYSKASFDSGKSWNTDVQVSEYAPPSFLEFPAIGSNGTQVHVAWDSEGIQYSQSEDSGITWSNPIPITNTTRQYLAPRISVSKPHIQVASAAISTVGTPPRITIDSDVYYLSSSDGGQSWTKPLSLTMHEFGKLSLAPAIWNQVDKTFVAWEDNRNGRLSIFFLSKPDFSELRGFEWKLFGLAGIAIVVTTIVYIGLETWFRRIVSRHKVRRRRSRRKSHDVRSKPRSSFIRSAIRFD